MIRVRPELTTVTGGDDLWTGGEAGGAVLGRSGECPLESVESHRVFRPGGGPRRDRNRERRRGGGMEGERRPMRLDKGKGSCTDRDSRESGIVNDKVDGPCGKGAGENATG